MLPQSRYFLAIAAFIPISAASAATPLELTMIGDGVYVSYGQIEESSPANLGNISNIGFVVGNSCVAVIDSGGSPAVGEKLRAAIKQTTDTPVCYVINTHVHPDHIFGNAAFDAEVVGHARLPAALAARQQTYLGIAKRDLGIEASAMKIVPPTKLVDQSLELDLGGRKLKLRAWPTSHTDNDLTVYDERTQTLWLGDLLFVDHLPVVDGSLEGWLAAIRQLQEIPAQYAIAGHGKTGAEWRKALARQERYLTTLRDETRAAIKAGKTIQQAVEAVGYGERGNWRLFDVFHKRNVTAAYAELEWEDQ